MAILLAGNNQTRRVKYEKTKMKRKSRKDAGCQHCVHRHDRVHRHRLDGFYQRLLTFMFQQRWHWPNQYKHGNHFDMVCCKLGRVLLTATFITYLS